MIRARSTWTAVVAVVVLMVLVTASVSAHAETVRSDPSPGSVLSAAPGTVSIWFSESMEAPPDAITVTGPDGRRVDGRDARVAPNDVTELTASVTAGSQGTYTVRWRAISADTHPVSGSFQFSVGAPSSAVVSPTSSSEAGVPWQAAGRWLHLLGLVVALGPLTLLMLFGGDRVVGHRLLWLSLLGSFVLVLAAPLMLVAQSIGIGCSISAGLGSEAEATALTSRWGVLWAGRVFLSLLLFGVCTLMVRADQRGKPGRNIGWAVAGLLIGAGLLLLTSLNGHPASTDPVWLSVLVDWVHLAATVAWIGGLLAISLGVLPGLRRRPDAERAAILSGIVPRFSTVALVSVEVLLLTGLYATWAHVSGPERLVTTGYGQTLLVKLGLIIITLAFAGVNLLVVRPKLAALRAQAGLAGPEAGRVAKSFGRTVGAETVLGVVILAVVGLLTSLPPAEGAASTQQAAPAQPAVTLAQNAGPTLVTLSIDPAGLGSNQLAATLEDPSGQAVRDAQVRVRVEPPESTGGAATSTEMTARDSEYQATVQLAPAGTWQLAVLVALPGQAEQRAPFTLTVPVRGAGELLVLADEAMNGLRSVVEENELSPGGAVVKTRYDYEAPDRMHYKLEQSGSTSERYVIGNKRYDRVGDGPWESGDWPAGSFKWPDYSYSERATEVTLLGREQVRGVDCFVVSFVDPSSGARYRFWIGTHDYLLRRYQMMATGHYMTSTFSGSPVI